MNMTQFTNAINHLEESTNVGILFRLDKEHEFDDNDKLKTIYYYMHVELSMSTRFNDDNIKVMATEYSHSNHSDCIEITLSDTNLNEMLDDMFSLIKACASRINIEDKKEN